MPKSSFTLDFVYVSLARPGTNSMCVALTSLFAEFSDSLHAKLMSRFQLIPLTLEETCLRETGSMLPCGSRPRKNAGSDLPEFAPDSPVLLAYQTLIKDRAPWAIWRLLGFHHPSPGKQHLLRKECQGWYSTSSGDSKYQGFRE